MQELLSLREERGPDAETGVLVAAGDLDLAAGGQLLRWVDDALGRGLRRLVVDLSEAGYLDTRALAALVEAERQAEAGGASLAVVSPRDARLRVIFELTRLERFLRLSDSRREAFAALA